MSQGKRQQSQWIPLGSVPEPLQTHEFVLEPLDAIHAEMDFAAFMACRQRLRDELQWGDWPREDYTVEENCIDLRRHADEFKAGEAFSYTVLNPEKDRCLGCVYLEKSQEFEAAQFAFWVVDEAIKIEEFLVMTVIDWLHNAWLFKRVVLPLRNENTKGISIANQNHLVDFGKLVEGPLSGYHCFISERSLDE